MSFRRTSRQTCMSLRGAKRHGNPVIVSGCSMDHGIATACGLAMTWFGVAGPVAPKGGGYRNLIPWNGRCPFPTLDHPVGAIIDRPPMPAASDVPPRWGGGTLRTPSPTIMGNPSIETVGAGVPDGPARSAKCFPQGEGILPPRCGGGRPRLAPTDHIDNHHAGPYEFCSSSDQ